MRVKQKPATICEKSWLLVRVNHRGHDVLLGIRWWLRGWLKCKWAVWSLLPWMSLVQELFCFVVCSSQLSLIGRWWLFIVHFQQQLTLYDHIAYAVWKGYQKLPSFYSLRCHLGRVFLFLSRQVESLLSLILKINKDTLEILVRLFSNSKTAGHLENGLLLSVCFIRPFRLSAAWCYFLREDW